MLEDALLRELILTYALALVLIVALARLRVPPVVALIATGAIAGPGGIRIVRTQEDVQLLAEVGIVLLLFTVGLDFALGDFRRVLRRVIGAGLLQIGLTAAVVFAVIVAATDRPMPLARVRRSVRGAFQHGDRRQGVERPESARCAARPARRRRSCSFRTCASSRCSCSCRFCPGQTPLNAVPLAIGRALRAMASWSFS